MGNSSASDRTEPEGRAVTRVGDEHTQDARRENPISRNGSLPHGLETDGFAYVLFLLRSVHLRLESTHLRLRPSDMGLIHSQGKSLLQEINKTV